MRQNKKIDILLLCFAVCATVVCAQNYAPVNSCPVSMAEWDVRRKAKNCRNPTPDYLCAAIQDEPKKVGEICTVLGLANPRTCAVLSKSTYNMDFLPCRATSGCPETHYTPSELYKYPICYNNFYGYIETTQPSLNPTTLFTVTTDNVENSNVGVTVGAVLTVLIIIVLVVISIIVVLRRKRGMMKRELCNEDEEVNTEAANPMIQRPTTTELKGVGKGSTFQKLPNYFAHILKRVFEKRDLSENLILYSTSLKEHLNENQMESLRNVKTTDDYDSLDIAVVFTLIMNFCKKIKPPVRGWGYWPPDNDHSVGADLERIRTTWNQYLDNGKDSPQVDEVLRRLTVEYGEPSTECVESKPAKIQTVFLRRDCEISMGIVITQKIKSAMKLLESSDVVLCKGAMGCGKTTAIRYIVSKFKEKGWETIWKEEYLNEEELVEDEMKETLICCDNLFGTFNFNECSFDSFIGNERLSTLQNKKGRIGGKLKVLLGIHQHVFDAAMKQNVNEVQFLQDKHFVIDMDQHTEAELLLIWKEVKTEGHCVRDKKCWFNSVDFPSVLKKLSINQGLVGNPVILSMYCLHHNFFSDDEFTKSPLTTLYNHFKSMKSEEKDRELFLALVYVVCLRVYKKEEYNDALAGMLDAFLSETKIKESIKNFPEYFNDEDETVEVKHELLSISLFKAAFEIKEIRNTLATYCDIGTILQLTRTKEDCDSDFVTCLPPSDKLDEDEQMLFLLKRIAKAKGTKLKRPNRAFRKIQKWKKKLLNKS